MDSRRLLVFLLAFAISAAFVYPETSFTLGTSGTINVNTTFSLSVTAVNDTQYAGGCQDTLNASSSSVLLASSGNPLSNYDISSSYSGTIATVTLKIISLGTYSISFSSAGCEYGQISASTILSIYGGNFSGHVYNQTSGTAFAGAQVALSSASYGTQTVFSDAAGFYSFPQTPSASDYSLTVTASGYLQNQSTSISLAENESKTTDFILYANQTSTPASQVNVTLTGFVFNTSTSSPLASITLTLQNSSANLTNSTNSNGAYSFGGLSEGAYSLIINTSGFSYYPASLTLSNGSNYHNISLSPVSTSTASNGTVYGYIRNSTNNASITNATVKISKTSYSNTSSTPSSGYYSFSQLSAGNYTIEINATSFVSRLLYFEVKNSTSAVELNISMFTYVITNLANGVSCSLDSQCSSLHCCSQLCTALACNLPGGATCSATSECLLGSYCCNSHCQSIPCVQTNIPAGGLCNQTYQCISGLTCCQGACSQTCAQLDEAVFIERSEVVVLGFKRIEVVRTLASNKSQGTSKIILSITNKDAEGINNFEYRETIPSWAHTSTLVEFGTRPFSNETQANQDLFAFWRYSSFAPGEKITLLYTINKYMDKLDGFSSFAQRYEETGGQSEKAARLIAPARIKLWQQVMVAVKDLAGNPIENAGVAVTAPNSVRTILITDKDGIAKYVATIEGNYYYSLEGYSLIESVKKTEALSDYTEPANITNGTAAGEFRLGGLDKMSIGVVILVLLLVAAVIVLVLIALFYYIYLKK